MQNWIVWNGKVLFLHWNSVILLNLTVWNITAFDIENVHLC